MKTKEQAAKEYAESFEENEYTIETEAAFISGVEFAEQWISVEDELPEEYFEEQVICKQLNGDYRLIVGRNVKNWIIGYINTDNAITHWKPIFRK